MNKKNVFLFFFLFVHIYILCAQQIITDNTLQPNQLIENLIGGDCATVSNISSSINGNVNNIISYGAFDRGTSNFPIQNGIILSTGRVSSAGNTYNSQNLSDGEITWETDSDIQDILGIDQTLNATSIEFDFSSVNNFVAFKYLFASDEYQQEYPCTFKDVFAVLIKRAGTADPYINIALVPETTAEITTNTIHQDINGFCEAQNETYFEGYNLGNTNFNGSTTVLTATTDIIPNETYHIKFIIADHIDERFDSAVFISAESFGNSIDLGPNRSICGSDLTLNADINNPDATYNWYFNSNLMTGQNSPTLNVSQSGTYNVEVSIPSLSGSCILEDSIELEIIPFQPAAPIQDITICDDLPNDGLYEFDFQLLKNDEIFDNLPSTNYTISYHFSQEDAQNNNNPIIAVYQNTEETETIYVRIESLSGDCLQIGSFNISVLYSPNTDDIILEICNGEITEILFASSLNSLDSHVSNFEFDRNVSYYLTEDDAINEISPLEDYPPLDEGIPFFIARVENIFSGCYSLVNINFEYQEPPNFNTRYIVNNCLPIDHYEFTDGESINFDSKVYTYNLQEYRELLESEFPGFTFRLLDFILAVPPVISSSNPSVNANFGVSIGDYCEFPIVLEFHKNLMYSILGEEVVIEECDDGSNDGIVNFNLDDISETIKNEYDISIELYETEEDAINNENPIDRTLPYSVINTQDLFIESSYQGCSYISILKLNVLESTSLSPQITDACGYFNGTDNTTTIFLQQFNDLVSQDVFSNNIEYYLTEEDAINEENVLGETFAVNGNTQRFYVKMSDLFLQCPDITTLDVTINGQIDIDILEPLKGCDDNLDGYKDVDLVSHIQTQFADFANYNISYYLSSEDAIEAVAAISNPSMFNTTTDEIFMRIEEPGTDCFAINNFEIQIYSSPQFGDISSFTSCEIDINNPSGFIFENKDFEILNGQTGMQVLYFETEDNAINKQDSIEKNSPYIANSNPQTIYVRLENTDEDSCYKTAPMQIEIRQAPVYNEPTDVFECDINNTGLVSTNLNEKITEITSSSLQNLNISFHLTPLNANLGTNELPLNYTTISSSQLIYSRIENFDSGCVEVASFYINSLSLPEVNFNQSFTACSDNFNTNIQWDLTQYEVEIIDGRQYNIDFTYFRSEGDLESNINPVVNPENYTNLSNPETVFVKVRNATTNCYTSVPVELIVNQPPPINPIENYQICENNDNLVDLSEITQVLFDDTYNVLVSYHANEQDANENQNALSLDYNYSSSSETLYVRAEYSTTHCFGVHPFQLVVNPLPIANPPNNLMACDDDFDGLLEFDLNTQNAGILNGQNPNDFSVSYHNSENDAIENMSPLNTDYISYDNEIIFARVENNTTGCFDITQFSVVVNPLPLVAIEDQVICLDNLPLLVSANTNNSGDTYLWSTDETSPEIEIYETGTYSVIITNQFGCENTSTFNVTESESATIDVVETIDFSDPNNITITVNGIGNYLYQLNNGNIQESNVFVNVPIGYNTVTIIDQNGCAQVTREVLVIDAPKHFTPNNDGDFDTWHIVGVEMLPGTVIQIFDRYGKFLKELNSNTLGWDGTYNGNQMPSGDYWYVATVTQNGKSFEVKGHFALRR
ncbi:choice-of-anchor L domain-containing protein [uncultured Winogradskyella sp.]|uniref:T9SS type B sorting domain-containing protein n=1 Tax=uncultured Winogradskyella sp. TaxID=395353 RepID=UPI00262BD4EA|nr:choice-of-anchor L domain-containing protein [uncultured Winogradskyella sp.]